MDKDGKFRIRGLVPGKSYSVSVTSEQLERTVPNKIDIKVEAKDT